MSKQFEPLREYYDSYYENLLLEGLNEGISIQELKNIVSRIKNPKKVFKNIVDKFNDSSGKAKKALALILIILASSEYYESPEKIDIEKIGPQMDKLSSIPILKYDYSISPGTFIKQILDKKEQQKLDFLMNLKTSDEGKQFIKSFEGDPKTGGPVLVAYKLKDGKITIGYGHAEDSLNSKMIEGKTKITPEIAEKLFLKDLSSVEDNVKKLLVKWHKEGLRPIVTQSMFDALVSMAFNMGTGGLRGSDFITDLKSTGLRNPEDIIQAAEKIKTTRINPEKFPGLEKRREKEHELFIRDIQNMA